MPFPAGLCCKPGGFHIVLRPVERLLDHTTAIPTTRDRGPWPGAATRETLDMISA